MILTHLQQFCDVAERHIHNLYPDAEIEFDVRPNGRLIELVCLAAVHEHNLRDLYKRIMEDPSFTLPLSFYFVLTGTIDPPPPVYPTDPVTEVWYDYNTTDHSLIIALQAHKAPVRKIILPNGILLGTESDGTIVSIILQNVMEVVKQRKHERREHKNGQSTV